MVRSKEKIEMAWRRAFRVAFIIAAAFSMAQSAQGRENSASLSSARAGERKPILSCNEVRGRIGLFLDMHYTYKTFDDEISRKNFKKLFELVDPGKNYFVESDVEQFRHLETRIDDLIMRGDCGFISSIFDIFLKRVRERNTAVMKLLEQPMSFDVDEEFVVDASKTSWIKDEAGQNEHWRKRVKFQILNMKIGDGEAKARERLRRRYEQIIRRYEEMSVDEVRSLYLNAFAASLDPHSSHYLPADEEEFNIKIESALEGIGATLLETDGYVTIDALIPGGPAQRDGNIKIGDKVIAVDAGDGSGFIDTVGMELSKAVRLIRGKKGTSVKILLLRKGTESDSERVTVSLVRDSIHLKSGEARSDVIELDGKRIGVVRLPIFYVDYSCRTKVSSGTECRGATADTLREIKKLKSKKVDGILLDLRENSGGDLPESIQLAGLFMPDGPIVQAVDRVRIRKTLHDQNSTVQYSGPLAVVVSKHTASASEIVAGALQDYGRALIVGDSRTYGKGTIQGVQKLPGSGGRLSGGAIKVTQAKFYRPSGKTNQKVGVEGDLVIPSYSDLDLETEREKDFALSSEPISPSADFKPLQDISGMITVLRAKSMQRMERSPDFVELREKLLKYKEQMNKTSVSLKESSQKKSVELSPKRHSEQDAAKKRDSADVLINKNDLQLFEAAHILIDAIEVRKGQSWVGTAATRH